MLEVPVHIAYARTQAKRHCIDAIAIGNKVFKPGKLPDPKELHLYMTTLNRVIASLETYVTGAKAIVEAHKIVEKNKNVEETK